MVPTVTQMIQLQVKETKYTHMIHNRNEHRR